MFNVIQTLINFAEDQVKTIKVVFGDCKTTRQYNYGMQYMLWGLGANHTRLI